MLRLSSNNPDLGEAQEELDVDYAGEPVADRASTPATCSTRSRPLGAKEIRLGLRDALSPAQLVPTDDADTLAVVMPMRL